MFLCLDLSCGFVGLWTLKMFVRFSLFWILEYFGLWRDIFFFLCVLNCGFDRFWAPNVSYFIFNFFYLIYNFLRHVFHKVWILTLIHLFIFVLNFTFYIFCVLVLDLENVCWVFFVVYITLIWIVRGSFFSFLLWIVVFMGFGSLKCFFFFF